MAFQSSGKEYLQAPHAATVCSYKSQAKKATCFVSKHLQPVVNHPINRKCC